ncbi:MAG: hypothetical protein EA383_09575 [Spirochaetaceae bacterium]|nr:MAG: hypothetical protein EA383_09575 [Spirochaetaceae bacterium]
MSLSKQRTSFALDSETIELVQFLASQWQVSQAEVVRRAVRIAAAEDQANTTSLQERLADFWDAGGVCAEQAEQYLSEVYSARQSWERGSGSDSP